MKKKILVAGGTGNLGGRILHELVKRGASVRAIVRHETQPEKIEKLKGLGADVVEVDMTDAGELERACAGVSCVVSAVSGLRDVIVDLQTRLLQSAVAAGVPRFIPSDFSVDFTDLAERDNRNFDWRREFQRVLNASPIAATSIMNGAFTDILRYGTPVYDFRNFTVGYWGDDPDWKMGFTSIDNTAEYTAAAALDTETPRFLRIASFQVSPNDLVRLGTAAKGREFRLVPMGSLADFAAANRADRAAHPETEREVFPSWQGRQYIHSMFTTHNQTLDNARYPSINWITAAEVLANI